MSMNVLVTGAGGFIGHHLVSSLKARGLRVRGVDLRRPRYAPSQADEFLVADLRHPAACAAAVEGMDEVYALAADMGGMGYISANHYAILSSNALIDLNTLEAAQRAGVRRFFFASSACVYPDHLQASEGAPALKEEDAYPAAPQDAYGWGKLMTERLCLHAAEEGRIVTRIARFHNVYGPLGTWEGGREKAPAAVCRKVAQAELSGSGEVEIWGDGRQTRSFCYIDDCVEGIHRLMRSGHGEPLNLGQDRTISIDELADLVARAAGVPIVKKYVPGPQGVRGRNSDNARLRAVLGWAPGTSLEEGLRRTYAWVREEVRRTHFSAAAHAGAARR